MLKQTLIAATLFGGLAAVLPACSSTRPDLIPAAAVETTSGKGDLTFLAGNPGTVYIYNRTWNQLVYSGPVERGQQVKIDTIGGRVLVDGRVVTQHPLGNDDQFNIYVDSSAGLTREQLREEEWRSRRAADMP